jgi:hypothetical protein
VSTAGLPQIHVTRDPWARAVTTPTGRHVQVKAEPSEDTCGHSELGVSRIALPRYVCMLDSDTARIVRRRVPRLHTERHELGYLAAVLADYQVRRCLRRRVAEPIDRAFVRTRCLVPDEQIDVCAVPCGLVRCAAVDERREDYGGHTLSVRALRFSALRRPVEEVVEDAYDKDIRGTAAVQVASNTI